MFPFCFDAYRFSADLFKSYSYSIPNVPNVETGAQVYQQTHRCGEKNPLSYFYYHVRNENVQEEITLSRKNHPFVTSAVRKQLFLTTEVLLGGGKGAFVVFFFLHFLRNMAKRISKPSLAAVGARCHQGISAYSETKELPNPASHQPVPSLFLKYTRFLLRSKANK